MSFGMLIEILSVAETQTEQGRNVIVQLKLAELPWG